MEEIKIVPGTYGKSLKLFFQSEKQPFRESEEGVILVSEKPEKLTPLLSRFIRSRCLLEEARTSLRKYCREHPCPSPELCEKAAHRAISCAGRETAEKLEAYFRESRTLNLEGFLKFRLRADVADARYTAQLCIRELIQEEKYRDFLMLLQSYVQECEPILENVLLLSDAKGHLHLFAEEGTEVTYEYADLDDAAALQSEEDLILSALLTIAPRCVYLYKRDSEWNTCLVDTIRKIFSVRELCEGGLI